MRSVQLVFYLLHETIDSKIRDLIVRAIASNAIDDMVEIVSMQNLIQ